MTRASANWAACAAVLPGFSVTAATPIARFSRVNAGKLRMRPEFAHLNHKFARWITGQYAAVMVKPIPTVARRQALASASPMRAFALNNPL